MTYLENSADKTLTAHVHTTALIALSAEHVRIEVRVTPGTAGFRLIAELSETAQRETRTRVISALVSVGIDVARYDIAIELKSRHSLLSNPGTLDLPIAVAVLAALGKVPAASLGHTAIIGELSMSGDIRPIRGALAHVLGAKSLGLPSALIPEANGAEAGAASGITVHVAPSLREVILYLQGELSLLTVNSNPPPPQELDDGTTRFDFSDILGKHAARRALEIAAAGNHNILLVGPPGSGATMLARRLTTILPALTVEEATLVTMIHSVAGLLPANAPLTRQRPFRAPHHTISQGGLVGAASPHGFRPGELSLAHFGVLFLDELTEFPHATLDAIPGILERGDVELYHKATWGRFPARPLVVGSVTTGGRPPRSKSNESTPSFIEMTAKTFDLRIPLELPSTAIHSSDVSGESSAAVRERVTAARLERSSRPSGRFNSLCASLDDQSARLVSEATARRKLTGTDYAKILRVARTIADLDGSDVIRSDHAAEAIGVTNVSFVEPRGES